MAKKITQEYLQIVHPELKFVEFSVDGMDLAGGTRYESFITFLDQTKFVAAVENNKRASVVLCTKELASLLNLVDDRIAIAVEDPRWTYFSIQNLRAAEREYPATQIHPTATIHPSATVADRGVFVDAGVVIEAGVVIHPSVKIGKDAVIRANAVLGSPGFEHKRTSKGILSVVHDGDTVIGARTEIGTLCAIAQGYERRHTVIGEDCRLDGHVYIAHGVHLANRVFLAAGAVIAGMCNIGDDVWVGPGANVRDQISIGEHARVAIGAVVLKDINAGETVIGNPAKRLHTSR